MGEAPIQTSLSSLEEGGRVKSCFSPTPRNSWSTPIDETLLASCKRGRAVIFLQEELAIQQTLGVVVVGRFYMILLAMIPSPAPVSSLAGDHSPLFAL